jgi:CheY-like chemotaxis protein
MPTILVVDDADDLPNGIALSTTALDALVDGVHALKQDHNRRIPAIAVTAYATAEDRSRALAAGYQGHIPKPIDPVAVASEIKRAIQEQGGSA